MEPVTRMRGAAHGPYELGAAERLQRLHQVARESGAIDFDVLRQNGERARALRPPAHARLRMFEPIDSELRDTQHRFGMLPKHAIERFARESRELRVAQSDDGA